MRLPLALSRPLGNLIDALPEGALVKINAGNPDEKPRIALIFSTAHAFGKAGQKDILNDTRERLVVYETDQSVGSVVFDVPEAHEGRDQDAPASSAPAQGTGRDGDGCHSARDVDADPWLYAAAALGISS